MKEEKLVSLCNCSLTFYYVWQTLDPLRTTDPQQNDWWVMLFAFVVLYSTDSEHRTGATRQIFKAKQSRFIWECVRAVQLCDPYELYTVSKGLLLRILKWKKKGKFFSLYQVISRTFALDT